MLRSLARVVLRHRTIVLVAWLALTAFGGFAAPHAVDRLLTTFSIPGSSAYKANQQVVKTFGNGDQQPLVVVFHDPSRRCHGRARGASRRSDARVAVNRGSRVSSYFNTKSEIYVSKDRHTTFAEIYPPGAAGFGGGGTVDATQRAVDSTAPTGVHGVGHRPGGARGGRRKRRWRRAEHHRRDAHRRARRARDPALRVRHAAGRADAAAGRGGLDPQHVHRDLAADVHHGRLGDRRVPDRARRPRHRDRLLAAADLPLPRGARARRDRRGGADREHGARGPLDRRLGLDRRHRPAQHDPPADPVHPLDRRSAAC